MYQGSARLTLFSLHTWHGILGGWPGQKQWRAMEKGGNIRVRIWRRFFLAKRHTCINDRRKQPFTIKKYWPPELLTCDVSLTQLPHDYEHTSADCCRANCKRCSGRCILKFCVLLCILRAGCFCGRDQRARVSTCTVHTQAVRNPSCLRAEKLPGWRYRPSR